mmetsp:Transcript_17280/g.30455  ORF Transcript_17280/g.30455 Transcript_17280/m.30455 type:complete len:356 (-) Transcript_17280:92-1159(-)|eukprot:CAMPEP_0184528790 /NCGR_PEP_ID=MMETSP0198_2-20121128/11993_1 /TAXON_ID=1112570 /ORGANISM="Thraustochytrium sp., Strain LLF1b" /LENGTH=355 /DNA_ID=CAMNT_0026920687 /DNA_START=186 /DNA_END=1250 /DNA_ORIENTATION=+
MFRLAVGSLGRGSLRSTVGLQGARQLSVASSAGYTDEHRAVIKGLKGKHLLCIDDYTKAELEAVLALSRHVKALHKSKALPKALDGMSMASIFQKRSTRTRVSSETGMALLGGTSLFLSSDDVQLGVNESIRDSALVLSRFNSIILARVFGHEIVEEVAQYSTVPVINALSSMYHPLQTLADYMTVQERFGVSNVAGKTLAWVGDGNNVLHDLMLAAPALGVNLRICTPQGHEPDTEVSERTSELASKYGTSVLTTTSPTEGVKGANMVVTDTWVSMGQEDEAKRRIRTFKGYQVTSELLSNASDDCIFMHCLPRHKEEVSDEVFYSDRSVVFDEAENRMYTVQAVILSMLGETL